MFYGCKEFNADISN
ncbi:hypothetical protein H2279_03925 [Campylobacter sp. B0100352/1]|nr:hypothetical protein [Campylobacter sp. B0100352/1]